MGFLGITLFFKTKKDVIRERQEKEYFTNQKKILNSFSKISILRQVEVFLREADYPYGITFEVYVKFIFILLIASIYVFVTLSFQKMIILVLLILVPLHLIIYHKNKERSNAIRISLCDIQDIVYMQNKIGTPTDIILANSARLAKGPLKIPFEKVSSTYKITRDLDKSLDILLKTSNIMELQAFVFILKQKETTGFSDENHKAQGIMLKRNKRLRKRIEREARRNKLIFAGVLLFACYVSMLVGPVFKETFRGIKQILN